MNLDDRLIEFDTWCLCGNKECVLSENFAENKKAILSDLTDLISFAEDRAEAIEKVKKYCE